AATADGSCRLTGGEGHARRLRPAGAPVRAPNLPHMTNRDTAGKARSRNRDQVLASPAVVGSSSPLGLPRRSPAFGSLFLATAGSSSGTYRAAIALTVDVYDATNSGVWVAALLIANFLPIVVIGLLLGPIVDRLSRRRLMIVSDLARFGVF